MEGFLQYIDDNRIISQINFFGTHDSLTAFVNMEKLSRCQSLTLSEQLELGVRLLDIRLSRKKGEFYLVHSLADCYSTREKRERLTFEQVYDQCLCFLRANPSQTLILSVKQDRGIQSRSFFPAFYKKYIKGREDSWYLGSTIPSLGECRGKLVLMRRCKIKKSFGSQYNSGLDFSRWRDQASKKSTSPLPVILNSSQRALVQDRYSLEPLIKWHKCAKLFLDSAKADKDNLPLHYLSTAYRYKEEGLEKTAREINGYFKEYPLKEEKGWFFFDFPDREIYEIIKNSNKSVINLQK